MIECIDLVHIYGNKKENVVLNGINLKVEIKEKVAIMGKSGSGKSTLLSIIGSLIIPTGGSIRVDGINLLNQNLDDILSYRRSVVGFVFQENNLIDFLNVYENLELPLRYSNLSTNERREIVNDIAKELQIYRYLEDYPKNLSGGEKQRVGIGVALVNKPKLILADEPTGNLDVDTSEIVYKFLVKLANKYEATLVIVTHDRSIAKYVDRIVDLSKLKISSQLNA